MKHYKKSVINPYNNKQEIKILNAYAELQIPLDEVDFVFVKKTEYMRGQIAVNTHLRLYTMN